MFNSELIKEIITAVIVFSAVYIFSECISKIYDKIKIKDSYKFVIFNLDTNLYYNEYCNKFDESYIRFAATIPVPEDKESYLKAFLLDPIGQKIISLAKSESDLRIGFKVIDPNTYKIIKEISI